MTTRVHNSITIVPGESFTLPPNSTVTSVIGTLGSTCDNLPTPETLGCYAAVYALGHGGSNSEPDDEITIKGFRINNVNYLFAGGGVTHTAGLTNLTGDLQTAIDSNAFLSSTISNLCASRYAASNNNGSRYIISFKAVPSLMVDAQIITEIDGGPLPSGGIFKALLPIETRTYINSTGSDDLLITCICS